MQRKIVIFDFDGTIADTLTVFLSIYNDLAPRYSCTPVASKDVPILRGMRPQDKMREYGITFWKMPFLVHAVRNEFRKRAPAAAIHNGISEVLRDLKDNGHVLGVLTSNSKDSVQTFLNQQALGDIFEFIVAHKNMFGKHKALKSIMKERGFSATDVAYVGDETRDMEAARRAGVKGVAVTWGFQNREAFARVLPDVVVDTPTELVAAVS